MERAVDGLATSVGRRTLLGAMALSGLSAGASGGSPGPGDRPGSAARLLFTAWLEGAAMTPDGTLYFSDVLGNRLYRVARGGDHATIFRDGANRPNGSVVDRRGRLVTCEAGDYAKSTPPRLTRTDLASGRQETLVELVGGRRLLGPNDVRVDPRGMVHFTDGQRPPFLPPLDETRLESRHVGKVDGVGVYRVESRGRAVRLLDGGDVAQPNGLGFSADGRYLFVNDDDPAPGGSRLLLRFAVRADGSAHERRVLHDFGRGRPGDGMIVDSAGDVVVCAGLNVQSDPAITADVAAGVHVFSPEGEPKAFFPIREDNVTNIVEDTIDRGGYLVTAGRSIYRIDRRRG